MTDFLINILIILLAYVATRWLGLTKAYKEQRGDPPDYKVYMEQIIVVTLTSIALMTAGCWKVGSVIIIAYMLCLNPPMVFITAIFLLLSIRLF